MRIFEALWRVLRIAFLVVVALVIFIEEWGWRPLAAGVAKLGRWTPVRRLEALIAGTSPRVALALFLVPAVLLFPVKVASLWLIEEGRALLGVSVIVLAKVLGTALVGRLFLLVESQLMEIAWFARLLTWWRETEARVRGVIFRSTVWRRLRIASRASRRWLRRRLG